jgi:hypothetical protein
MHDDTDALIAENERLERAVLELQIAVLNLRFTIEQIQKSEYCSLS